MNTIIKNRRSVRLFKSDEIPCDIIREVLTSAMYAPSSKNKQPWRFIVCMGKTKSKIVETFKQKILHALHEQPNNISLKMALKTAAVIQMAPTLILIGYDGVNGAECTNDGELWRIISPQAECCDIQAIGAAIQNLILEAESRNIGSLWVCDILYAYDEIMEIVGFDTQIIAGVVLGYSDETPIMPPRNINKIQWLV